MSKGSKRRPASIPWYEEKWRWDLALGHIDLEMFNSLMDDVSWLRSNNRPFDQMPPTHQALARFIGKRHFERWDGANGWVSGSDGDFIFTFTYRLKHDKN